jgi:hypothetical protein
MDHEQMTFSLSFSSSKQKSEEYFKSAVAASLATGWTA